MVNISEMLLEKINKIKAVETQIELGYPNANRGIFIHDTVFPQIDYAAETLLRGEPTTIGIDLARNSDTIVNRLDTLITREEFHRETEQLNRFIRELQDLWNNRTLI